MRWWPVALVLASSPAFAQTAPGAADSPAERRNPAQPEAPKPVPSEPVTSSGPVPAETVPPIPVVPQPPPSPPPPPPPTPRTPPSQLDPSTRVSWKESYHFDGHWRVLMLPAYALELAFAPFGLLVSSFEKYRLDQRIGDLLSVDNLGVKLSPRFKFSFGDGAGAGLWVKRTKIFDWRSSLRVGGLIRLDRDWQLETEYDHALLLPGGRGLRARAYIERDKNQRYFGIGSATSHDDKRVLQTYEQGALLEVDLQGVDHYTTSGIAQVGIRRQELSPGVDPVYPAVMVGDTVMPPPGFDTRTTYLDAQLVGRYDTRDIAGRPTRGILLEGTALGRRSVTGPQLSATTVSGTARVHVPVLPDRRVLVLSLAGAAALPLVPGDDKPLDSLVVIGRTNVRGYDRDRFRDLYAVVASAEYRFPIYEYLASHVGLDAFTFVDAGTIWGTDKFDLNPLRYSVGGGIRGASEVKMFLETTFAWSPEGVQFNIGLEKVL